MHNEKIKNLRSRIMKLQRHPDSQINNKSKRHKNFGSIGVEIVSPILVVGYLGWFFDNLLDTRPICIILGTILGVVTGWVNIVRIFRGK